MSWYVTDNHTLHLHLVGNTRLSAPTQHNEEEHPMTSLQIELPPELYARLQDEAQRQGKAEKLLAEELLADQLRSTTALEVPLYVHMMPHIRALVTTMNIDDFTVPGDGSPDEAIALLRLWSAAETEDDDEGTESWEDVLRSIDASRTSNRKLFPGLEQSE